MPPSKSGYGMRHMSAGTGTEIEILFRHWEYWTALKVEGKEKAENQWQAVQKAKWIDHNGGGWTWHGMMGAPMGWRPINASRE